MVLIYRNEEIIQNGMIDKIKSGIFNYDLILLVTINSHNIKSLTLGSLKYALTQLSLAFFCSKKKKQSKGNESTKQNKILIISIK
jgi:hypothetical protein